MDISNREALTVREFCARNGITRPTFYKEVREDRLRAVKLRTKTIVFRSDEEAWRKSLPKLVLAVAG
jgi:excisionase family DNA binding protein